MSASATTSMLDELPKFRGKILKWLAAFGVPPDDVEDLAQEVLSAAVRYRESFDPSKPLSPWLKTIARNIAIRYFKAKGEPAPMGLAEEPVAHDETPERTAFDREMGRTLADIFDELSPAERELLTLRYVDGRSTKEIAALLSIPEPTVKSRLQRTLERCFEGFRARGIKDRPGSLLVPLLLASHEERRLGGGSSDPMSGSPSSPSPPSSSTPPRSLARRVLESRPGAFIAGGVLVYLLLQLREPAKLASAHAWVRAYPVTLHDTCVAPKSGEVELPAGGAAPMSSRKKDRPASPNHVAASSSDPLADFANVEGIDQADVVETADPADAVTDWTTER